MTCLDLGGVSLLAGEGRLLDAIDLTIGARERVGIVAQSGAGKSRLLRLALGLVPPLSGTVSLLGTPLASCSADAARRLRRRCGALFGGGSLISGLTVEDNLWLALDAPAAARPRLRRRLNRIGHDFDITHLYAAAVETLSAGEWRRVELARAFFGEPELVLLDEPFAGATAAATALEAVVRRQVIGRNRAMLLLTQDTALAHRLCERVHILDQGRLTPG